MHWIIDTYCFRLLLLFGLLLTMTSCASSGMPGRKKMTGWIHFHPCLPRHQEAAMEFGRRVKADGYQAIVMRVTNERGYSRDATRKLVNYLKHDLQLEVIPEFKLLGKSSKTFGAKFVKQHPKLFVGQVIDPYAEYNGKPAFDSLIIPVVDEHLDIFDHPRYFLLGWDETNTDNIKRVADRNGRSVSEVWAGTLNRVSDYLLGKGVTPIIFGDMLLSSRLALKDNPLGYPPDKRFMKFSAMHSRYPANTSKTDMLELVRDIRNRDRMIVADWHYSSEKEYPSIDYFQWLGFRDVIPVTWGNPENMKYFSQYAAARGCRIMMASVWHYFFHPSVRHLLWPTVDNSIIFFKNPGRKIPIPPRITILKDGTPATCFRPGETAVLSMSPAGLISGLMFTRQ